MTQRERILLQFSDKNNVNIDLKTVSLVEKGVASALKNLKAASSDKDKAKGIITSLIQNYNFAAKEFNEAINNSQELEKSAKALGIDLPGNIAGLKKVAQDGMADALSNIKAAQGARSSIS